MNLYVPFCQSRPIASKTGQGGFIAQEALNIWKINTQCKSQPKSGQPSLIFYRLVCTQWIERSSRAKSKKERKNPMI